MKTLIVNHQDVERLLPMSECIDSMEKTFRELAAGEANLPERSITLLPNGKGTLAVMPAFLRNSVGAKVMTIFPGNSSSRFESHQGAVLLFELENGRLLSIMDSTSITAIRTAAVSAVATKVLSRKDSTALAILGSGAQASAHLKAMSIVRHISSVKVWSRNYEHAKKFAASGSPNIKPIRSAMEAVANADIICTTTSSQQPVLKGEWIPEGAHINAVGAYTSSTRELDSEAVRKSLLFVDSRESALIEAGDFLIPRREGTIADSHIKGELGELLVGKVQGRTDDRQITLFKSLGLAVEDIAAASRLYQVALSESSGTWLEFGKERGIPY